MAQLRITVGDELSLIFSCANYAKVRARALDFVGDSNKLKAKCDSSAASATLEFCPDEDAVAPVWDPQPWSEDFDAFFFDNTTYNVYAELGEHYKNLRVKSRFAADEDPKKFARLGKDGRARSGALNFENDVGKFKFALLYDGPGGTTKEYTFSSEVLSQKLDARADWKVMVDDVERRYAMLAADYLRRTFHSFERKRTAKPDTPDLIWWSLFESERKNFFDAIRTILERPRRRLRNVEEFVRADQIRRITPLLENQIGEFRMDAGHLYRIEYDSHSHDTPENRFVKYALQSIGKKYGQLRRLICQESQFGKRLSDNEKERMAAVEKTFAKRLAHPFFKGVGQFKGIRQLSLTLQNAPGYATVARTFAMLNASHMLFEGLRSIETKSIADLYEIWCFLKVEDIVKTCCKERFGDLFAEPLASHGELSGKFVKQLGTGTESEVVFRVGDVELARVVYNPKVSDRERRNNGMPNVVVPTGLTDSKGQIPDIVLQLSRRSMYREEPYRLTYLFDAKYRIEDVYGDDDSGAMRPPQDAIDQMHRYRDAIYYADQGDEKSLNPSSFKKEVIGGYVLFPGVCDKSVVKSVDEDEQNDGRPPYFQSIDRVNIGAIPLRPNSKAEYRHLYDFVQRLLIENPTLEAALGRINPQKGEALDAPATGESVAEALLYGTYKNKKWIIDNGKYPLPIETAEKIGIKSLSDARKRRVLVLIAPRGYTELSSPFKIVGECSRVSKDDLQNRHGYPNPSHEEYYLFQIVPLIEPLADVKNRLKLVICDKEGVSKGVNDFATEKGFEIEVVPSRDAALAICDGVVLFDDTWVVAPELRGILNDATLRMRSHQPLAMNMRLKKAREEMVRWLRILLNQVQARKYVLYIDGREDDETSSLEKQAGLFLLEVLRRV